MEVSRRDGTKIEELPAELFGSRLRPETWIADASDPLSSRASEDLPTVMTGARMEGTAVLFGVLSGEPAYEAVRDSLRRYRNQATIARSWLGADAANLQLFLATPPGSAGDAAWQELAALIEADDRVCRKLVWLLHADSVQSSAEEFLTRTFLASPWSAAVKSDAPRLDSMSVIELPEGWDEAVIPTRRDSGS